MATTAALLLLHELGLWEEMLPQSPSLHAVSEVAWWHLDPNCPQNNAVGSLAQTELTPHALWARSFSHEVEFLDAHERSVAQKEWDERRAAAGSSSNNLLSLMWSAEEAICAHCLPEDLAALGELHKEANLLSRMIALLPVRPSLVSTTWLSSVVRIKMQLASLEARLEQATLPENVLVLYGATHTQASARLEESESLIQRFLPTLEARLECAFLTLLGHKRRDVESSHLFSSMLALVPAELLSFTERKRSYLDTPEEARALLAQDMLITWARSSLRTLLSGERDEFDPARELTEMLDHRVLVPHQRMDALALSLTQLVEAWAAHIQRIVGYGLDPSRWCYQHMNGLGELYQASRDDLIAPLLLIDPELGPIAHLPLSLARELENLGLTRVAMRLGRDKVSISGLTPRPPAPNRARSSPTTSGDRFEVGILSGPLSSQARVLAGELLAELDLASALRTAAAACV